MKTSVDEILTRSELLAMQRQQVTASNFTFLKIISLCVRKYLTCSVKLNILNGLEEALFIRSGL